jgi:mRNA interferase RelE/StbE
VYRIQFSESCCLKYFNKLPKNAKQQIIYHLQFVLSESPKEIGDPLKGKLSGYWRSRVGDYRVVYRIEEEALVVLVVKIAHRKDVYL